MASLIMQDSFEPYYEGRDDEAKARSDRPRRRREVAADAPILLPSKAPAPEPDVARQRRAVAH